MSTIYIDQTSGVDARGRGTIDQPYQTLAYAIFSTLAVAADGTQYQIRKGPDTEYDVPTQSATKKAKKDAQGLEKKRLKAEADERDARERQEKREKRLEESKKIVLVEDPSLPTPIKVCHYRGWGRWCADSFFTPTVKDCPPRRPQRPARSRLWMGPSEAGSAGDHVRGPKGWHWVSASRIRRANRKDSPGFPNTILTKQPYRTKRMML